MTIKTFLQAMQSDAKGFEIYKIDEAVKISYDPEQDTKFVSKYEKYNQIPAELLNAEIQDFFITEEMVIIFYI